MTRTELRDLLQTCHILVVYQTKKGFGYNMKMPFRDEDLVALIKSHPCIYDVSCQEYKDQQTKAIVWKRIAETLFIGE